MSRRSAGWSTELCVTVRCVWQSQCKRSVYLVRPTRVVSSGSYRLKHIMEDGTVSMDLTPRVHAKPNQTLLTQICVLQATRLKKRYNSSSWISGNKTARSSTTSYDPGKTLVLVAVCSNLGLSLVQLTLHALRSHALRCSVPPHMPISVAYQSMERVCDSSLTVVTGSNPAEVLMSVWCKYVCCLVEISAKVRRNVSK